MQRTITEDMREEAHVGHPSEGAWTNTDDGGGGIASSMVHIVGVAVFYYGKGGSKLFSSRHYDKHLAFDGIDMLSVPRWAWPLQAPTVHEDS